MVTLVCKKSGGVVTFKEFFTMMEMFSHIYVIRQILQDIRISYSLRQVMFMCGIASCICHFNWLHLPYLGEVIAGFLFIFTILEEIDLLLWLLILFTKWKNRLPVQTSWYNLVPACYLKFNLAPAASKNY